VRGFLRIPIATLVLVSALLAGCGRSSEPSSVSAGESPATGNGTITGKVILAGTPPTQLLIPGSPQIKDETLVCDPSGGIQNVIVFLANAPEAAKLATDRPPVILDQVNCVYVPHVLAVQTGQPLIVKSSDSCMHNVQFQDVKNPPYNFGFSNPSSKQIALQDAEPPFRVKCDVHPWMTAWIGVFNHPYFAVTASDGSFTISHLPPGTYTLEAWHEALPQQQQSITVSDSSTSDVKFTFQLP
jgi:Polysaccharide lyase family 4, domain II